MPPLLPLFPCCLQRIGGLDGDVSRALCFLKLFPMALVAEIEIEICVIWLKPLVSRYISTIACTDIHNGKDQDCNNQEQFYNFKLDRLCIINHLKFAAYVLQVPSYVK